MKSQIIQGNAIKIALPDESVHCVVTSPPYWSLRKYPGDGDVWDADPACKHEWVAGRILAVGRHDATNEGLRAGRTAAGPQQAVSGAFCRRCNAWRGQLGLEPTVALYIEHMVAVFREVWRVLRQDGTCWVNIGDSYAANRGYQVPDNKHKDVGNSHASRVTDGLKPKDLCLIPERLAIALQDAGWYVRSRIAWCKRAPMPESVTDRPTSAWEHIWLLSKSERYYYDADAVKEKGSDLTARCHDVGLPSKATRMGVPGNNNGTGAAGLHNMRNFWLLGPEPYPDAHFATFPTEIPRRAILAGTSERGCCAECGAPWRRMTSAASGGAIGKAWLDHAYDEEKGAAKTVSSKGYQPGQTLGWQPTCAHKAAPVVPCTVLDPFGGSGTTAEVAKYHGRSYVLVEQSPEYIELACKRIASGHYAKRVEKLAKEAAKQEKIVPAQQHPLESKALYNGSSFDRGKTGVAKRRECAPTAAAVKKGAPTGFGKCI